MNNTEINTFTCVFIFVAVIGSLLFVNNFHVYKTVFASAKKIKFNGADFKIKLGIRILVFSCWNSI